MSAGAEEIKKNKKADVVIPTYRPGKEFRIVLERLEKQSVPPEKVVVMNTEEQFWDRELEKKFPFLEVHHVRKKDFDHGGTRREAARYCEGDILVYMTQDAVPENRRLLEKLIQPILEEEKVAASYARQVPRKDCGVIERYTRAFNYPSGSSVKRREDLPRCGVKTFFCSNVCAAYDRNVFEQLGGFEQRAVFNEDMVYAFRVMDSGYGIAYAADARVIHSHNYSCARQFSRNFDVGVSQACHPEVFQGVPSEGEGVRLVKNTASYLVKQGYVRLLPILFAQSAAKYAGYLAGKNFRRLPRGMVKAFSMNKEYWNREFREE